MQLFSRTKLAWGGTFLAVGVLLSAMGCGPGSGDLSGKVYYQGKALTGGMLLYQNSAEEFSGSTSIGADGSYKITNVPGGTLQIAVDTSSGAVADPTKVPKEGQGYSAPGGMQNPNAAAGAATGPAGPVVQVPAQYASIETSNLSVEVTGGDQQEDIKIP